MNQPVATRRTRWIVAGIFGLVLCGLAVYWMVQGWKTLHLMEMHNRLKAITLALHHYHDQFGQFPPVAIRNKSGRALHSWRAMILPNLAGLEMIDERFAGYDFSQTWDSPQNLKFAQRIAFQTSDFSVLAVVGPGASWSETGTLRTKDFTDGLSNTIHCVGLRNAGVGWYEPRDLTFDGRDLWLYDTQGVRHAVSLNNSFLIMLDGSVVYTQDRLPPDHIKPLVTRSGGETLTSF